MINTNLRGALLVCRGASRPFLQASRAGLQGISIVNIGSVIGSIGNAGQVGYAASKAGLSGMTKSLSKELGPRGIRVNCVEPGFIESSGGGMTDEIDAKTRDRYDTACCCCASNQQIF